MTPNTRTIIRRYDRYPIYNIRANVAVGDTVQGTNIQAGNVSFNSSGLLTYDINATTNRVNLLD